MRLHAASLTILVSVAFLSGCGDSATEITGTLPVVTGITVDSLASRGDTIVVTWTALNGTDIEGYLLWSRINIGDPWTLLEVVDLNYAEHIADRSAYYTVMAFDGENTSSSTGIPDDSRADNLTETEQAFTGRPVGFRVDLEGDSLVTGDPASLNFSQQFTIALDPYSEELYIYPGTAHPESWPGGARTMVSPLGGFVAPSPGDSTLWKDSLLFGGTFFLSLESGHYCMLNSQQSSLDTLLIDGQLQPIMNVRVFNQPW
jgi:hypothetical protein